MSEQENQVAESWREVGRQLDALGKGLASAFKAAWESQETRQHVDELQAGFESMVRQVEQAVKETAESPEGQRFQQDVDRAAQSAREALDQAAKKLGEALDELGHSE